MSTGIPVLRWPLQVGPDGRMEMCSTLEEGWAQRVKMIVTTRLPERVMRTTYGCEVPDGLFAPVPMGDPKKAVRDALARWAPQIEVLDVEVTYGGSSEVVLVIHYRIPGGTVQEVRAAFRSQVVEAVR